MKLRSSKAAMYVGVAVVTCIMPVMPVVVDAKTTYEQQQSTQLESEFKQASYTENVSDIVATGYEKYEETDLFTGMAIAIADPYTEVFESADDASAVLGRLYADGIAEAVEVTGGWTKIRSGSLTGFVSTSALCFASEAADLAGGSTSVTVTVTAGAADVYSSANTGTVIRTAENGETFPAVGKCGNYIAVALENQKAYVSAQEVVLDYGFESAYTNEEAEAKEAAEEAARIAAEEERLQAEAEARRAAQEAEAARIAQAMASIEVSYNPTMAVSNEEVWLLACIIDWEAAWESYDGKLAVANVVLNRVRNPRYADSITGVVYARSQFSGVSDGYGNPSSTFSARLSSGPRNSECMQAAMEALSGVNNIGSFTSFRALYVANFSAYSSYTIIGNHVFF